MNTKSLFASKTFYLNVIPLLAIVLTGDDVTKLGIPPWLIMKLVALVNILTIAVRVWGAPTAVTLTGAPKS